MQEVTAYPVPLSIIMVVIVAAVALAAMAITAWLLNQITRRALDKATPDAVESVVRALGTLIDPLRMFLPWSRWDRGGPAEPGRRKPSDKDRK